MGGKSASKAAANEAAQARRDEEERQFRIKNGTDMINRIFYGGQVQTVNGLRPISEAEYDSNQTYYNPDGSVFTTSGQPLSGRVEAERAIKEGRLMAGNPTTQQVQGQFNDNFFNSIADNYTNFALPQLQEQHTKAGDELIYDLARTGNLDSSTRATKGAELQKAYDLNKQSIADKALSLKNDTKNAVEDARFNIISQLNATGDADGAANAAMTRASALSQPSMDFSPLTGLFADFTSGLGNAYAQERAYAASGGASHGGVNYGNAATGRKGTVTVRG